MWAQVSGGGSGVCCEWLLWVNCPTRALVYIVALGMAGMFDFVGNPSVGPVFGQSFEFLSTAHRLVAFIRKIVDVTFLVRQKIQQSKLFPVAQVAPVLDAVLPTVAVVHGVGGCHGGVAVGVCHLHDFDRSRGCRGRVRRVWKVIILFVTARAAVAVFCFRREMVS